MSERGEMGSIPSYYSIATERLSLLLLQISFKCSLLMSVSSLSVDNF